MDTIRERILNAAVRIYGEAGFRGATTRRIAQEAGVNEVTLFRLFGSKAALIECAVRQPPMHGARAELPVHPVDPEAELTAWATRTLEHLHANRALIRTTLGEIEEHPGLADTTCEGPRCAFEGLYAYASGLRRHGVTLPDAELRAAVSMLIGALFADAVGHHMIPPAYRRPPKKVAAASVRFFLRGIGYPVAGSGTSTGGNGTSTGRRGATARRDHGTSIPAARRPSSSR